jgi:D-lactate dehydrogenase (cytochrome)
VLVDPDAPEMVADAKTVHGRIVERAIELGGTSTGEHGVGRGKREYLVAEHGAAGVEAMRSVKRALDPNDTLNPGKIFPETARGDRVTGPSADD